jgi:hypothetical protein
MKINEVLTEGPLDFARKIGGKIKGAVANYQSASTQKDQQIKVNNIVKGALQKWNAVQSNLTTAGKDITPEVFLQLYDKFSGGQEHTTTLDQIDPLSVKQWLTKEIGSYLANKELTTEPEQTPGQPKDLPPSADAGQTTPNIIIPPGAKTAGPATTTTAQATAALTPSERFQKVQNEPIIMKYKNFEFGLNDQGQWSRLGSNKGLPQNYQAMLDKAAGYV